MVCLPDLFRAVRTVAAPYPSPKEFLNMHRIRSRAALAAAGLAALALVAAGCGGSSNSSTSSAATKATATAAPATTQAASAAPATSGPVTVTLTEWKIAPTPDAAKAGKVTFDVTNNGSAPHEMVVIRTNKSASALGSGSHVPETGSVGETGDIAAGKSKSVTLTLKPGHYALICNIAGHYMAGMHTDFMVS